MLIRWVNVMIYNFVDNLKVKNLLKRILETINSELGFEFENYNNAKSDNEKPINDLRVKFIAHWIQKPQRKVD